MPTERNADRFAFRASSLAQTSQDEGGNLFLLGIQDLPWKGASQRPSLQNRNGQLIAIDVI